MITIHFWLGPKGGYSTEGLRTWCEALNPELHHLALATFRVPARIANNTRVMDNVHRILSKDYHPF